MQPIVAHCCEVMYLGCFDFRGELGFLNCDDICMCVVNKQPGLLEFGFESVHLIARYVCLCGVGSPVAVPGLCARLPRHPMLRSVCDMCMCLSRGGRHRG